MRAALPARSAAPSPAGAARLAAGAWRSSVSCRCPKTPPASVLESKHRRTFSTFSPETVHTRSAHTFTHSMLMNLSDPHTHAHRDWTETSDVPLTVLTEARRHRQMVFVRSRLSQAGPSGKPTVMLKTRGRRLGKRNVLTRRKLAGTAGVLMLYHSRRSDDVFVCLPSALCLKPLPTSPK